MNERVKYDRLSTHRFDNETTIVALIVTTLVVLALLTGIWFVLSGGRWKCTQYPSILNWRAVWRWKSFFRSNVRNERATLHQSDCCAFVGVRLRSRMRSRCINTHNNHTKVFGNLDMRFAMMMMTTYQYYVIVAGISSSLDSQIRNKWIVQLMNRKNECNCSYVLMWLKFCISHLEVGAHSDWQIIQLQLYFLHELD